MERKIIEHKGIYRGLVCGQPRQRQIVRLQCQYPSSTTLAPSSGSSPDSKPLDEGNEKFELSNLELGQRRRDGFRTDSGMVGYPAAAANAVPMFRDQHACTAVYLLHPT